MDRLEMREFFTDAVIREVFEEIGLGYPLAVMQH